MLLHDDKLDRDKLINDKDHKSAKNISASYVNIAFDLCANLLVAIALGVALDKYFTTKPVFLVICLVVSFIAVIKIIISA